MKLSEVFDTPNRWEHTNKANWDNLERSEDDQAYWSNDTYKFEVDGKRYSVVFLPGNRNHEFAGGAPKDIPKFFDIAVLNDAEGSTDITGAGDAYKVFATTYNIIKKHKQQVGVPVLVGAKRNEPSRVKLYSRMFDKIATHKWNTTLDPRPGQNSGESLLFWLI